jgi:hypothetical protein
MSTQNRSKDFKCLLNITVNSDLKHIRTDIHDLWTYLVCKIIILFAD